MSTLSANLTSLETHTYYLEDARKYGVNASIVLYHIRFWLTVNKRNYKNDPKNDRYVKDGRVWAYGSIRYLHEKHFDYLTIAQVREAINKLIALGALIKGCYNYYAYNRSSWYSINDDNSIISGDDIKSISEIEQTDLRFSANQKDTIRKSNKDSTLKEDKNNKIKNNIYTDFKKSDSSSLDLLKYWNDKQIVKHAESSTTLEHITNILKSKKITPEAARMAIDNYKRVLDLKGWFTYKWGLKDFLKRGFERFEQDSFVLDNYTVKDRRVIKDESFSKALKEQMHEDIANSVDSMELKIDYFQSQGMTYDESTRFFSRTKPPKRELWDNLLLKRKGPNIIRPLQGD